MPKYSDYREWESHRDKLLEEQNTLRKLGYSTYDTVPSLPPEGIVNWLDKQKDKRSA